MVRGLGFRVWFRGGCETLLFYGLYPGTEAHDLFFGEDFKREFSFAIKR